MPPELPKPQPIDETPAGLASNKRFYRRWWFWLVAVVASLLIVAAAAAVWYNWALGAVDQSSEELVRVQIEPGSTPDMIAAQLSDEGVIRSKQAFLIEARLQGVRGQLKAGAYRLSPSESTRDIIDHLVAGQVNEFTVEFFPGSAISADPNPNDQTKTHREILLDLGYSEAEVEAGLAADYSDHPLLADKPAQASLEGYIYGVRFQVEEGASVEDILRRSFDEFYEDITERQLVPKLRKQGWDLHQAVTLASIIQREVSSPEDQRQVAQVFYSRLDIDMPLGADATFVYAAARDGAQPSVDYDSPYNTRIHTGLPPGPIASPNISALEAVANPAGGDYLYFVSGDDGKNYFSRTLEEHERNTREHCQVNCSLF